MKSFMVDRGAKLFDGFGWISLFHPIRAIIPSTRGNYGFVDWWVLGHFIFASICLSVSSLPKIQWWEIILLSYGGIRIFEIIVYQTNVLLFDQYRSKKNGQTIWLRWL